MIKEDAIQFDILDESLDIAEISPRQLVQIFSKYLQKMTEQYFKHKDIDKKFLFSLDNLLECSNKFYAGIISSDDLEKERIKTWYLHDAEENLLKKGILRAIVCCLYEENLESNKDSEIYQLVELYFSLLLDIDEKHCKEFRVFIEQAIK